MNGIFLLLGTNKGDLKENLRTALARLEENQINIIKKSMIYKTKPWGKFEQPDFLNMAVEIECNYSPSELLQVVKEIESQMGREINEHRWGPRIIDIDILFYQDKVIRRKDLIIPHKEVYNRSFAIKPLSEISPDFIPPRSKKRIKDYLPEVESEGIEIYRG